MKTMTHDCQISRDPELPPPRYNNYSYNYRGVAQLGQSSRFGIVRSKVRILLPRLLKFFNKRIGIIKEERR